VEERGHTCSPLCTGCNNIHNNSKAQDNLHIWFSKIVISYSNPIEWPLIRIVFFKTILMSSNSIGFGEGLRKLSKMFHLRKLIWSPDNRICISNEGLFYIDIEVWWMTLFYMGVKHRHGLSIISSGTDVNAVYVLCCLVAIHIELTLSPGWP